MKEEIKTAILLAFVPALFALGFFGPYVGVLVYFISFISYIIVPKWYVN